MRWWEHEGEGWRDNARYLWCRIVGHRVFEDGPYVYYCGRCGDVLPQGPNPRQP